MAASFAISQPNQMRFSRSVVGNKTISPAKFGGRHIKLSVAVGRYMSHPVASLYPEPYIGSNDALLQSQTLFFSQPNELSFSESVRDNKTTSSAKFGLRHLNHSRPAGI